MSATGSAIKLEADLSEYKTALDVSSNECLKAGADLKRAVQERDMAIDSEKRTKAKLAEAERQLADLRAGGTNADDATPGKKDGPSGQSASAAGEVVSREDYKKLEAEKNTVQIALDTRERETKNSLSAFRSGNVIKLVLHGFNVQSNPEFSGCRVFRVMQDCSCPP